VIKAAGENDKIYYSRREGQSAEAPKEAGKPFWYLLVDC
jgi:hypothetical protein